MVVGGWQNTFWLDQNHMIAINSYVLTEIDKYDLIL